MPLVNGGTSVKFNGTELQSANVIISSIEPYGGLQKSLNYLKLSRSNKSRKTNQVYPSRIIPCSGKIVGSSVADLKTQVDAFQALLDVPTGVAANLDIDIDQAGNYRRWVADPQELQLESGESLFSVNFSFGFICGDPFGRNVSSTNLINAAVVTTTGGSNAMTPGGTAPQQLPVFTLTLNSFTTSATSNTITITNPATGQAISITRTWTAADVIVLDLFNQTVTVNGTAVDYQGPLTNMSWKPGAGTVSLSDDFSARNITLTVDNVNRYK